MPACLLLPLLLGLAPQETPKAPATKAPAGKAAKASKTPKPEAAPAALAPEAQAVLDAVEAKGKAIRDALKVHLQAGKPRKDFRVDVDAELAQVAERLKADNPTELREALLLARWGYLRLAFKKPSPEQMEDMRGGIRAVSPVWKAQPGALAALMDVEKPEQKAYLLEAMDKNPAPEVRRAVLSNLFLEAFWGGDEPAWKSAFARLEKEHPGSREALDARRWVESSAKTMPGKAAPALSIPALGEPGTVYSLDTFKGKVVMLDFWATWCGPCRAELPAVHKAYARFKDRGFEILSLSFDQKAEDIAPFRAKPETPMPWKHAFVEGGFQSGLAKAYGVLGIPKPVLVGPDGKILAVDAALRGEKLEQTLEKVLGK